VLASLVLAHSASRFLLTIQRDDGSWYGSWGCCFTYATWFGIEGLTKTGMQPSAGEALTTEFGLPFPTVANFCSLQSRSSAL
jgi:hypothetical protein